MGADGRATRWLSFDALQTYDLPGVRSIKAERWLEERDAIERAEWVFFPPTWQVNALEYGFRKRVFPSPACLRLGSDKVEMTRAFAAVCPGHVPHTEILPATDASVRRVSDTMDFPVVVKEPRSSMGRGVHLVESEGELRRLSGELPMLYVQERLPIDREARVVIVGRDCLGAYWKVAREGWFHNNVARFGAIDDQSPVPDAVIELVVDVARKLGVDHAGFDVAVVGDHPYLLELNVRFGDRGLRQQGLRTGPAILAYLESLGASSSTVKGGGESRR